MWKYFLQKEYQIEEPLIIVKVDIKRNDTNSTQVEYQVFNPKNITPLLDLSLCNKVKIYIYPPTNNDEDIIKLAKHLKKQGYDFLIFMIIFIMICELHLIHIMILMFY